MTPPQLRELFERESGWKFSLDMTAAEESIFLMDYMQWLESRLACQEVTDAEIEEFRMAVTGILFVKFGGRVDLPEIVETIAQMLPNTIGKGERTQVTKEMR